MATISTAGEAVACVAYAASDWIVSVQPSLAWGSEFSKPLHALLISDAPNFISPTKPTIETSRQNADPFLSVYEPARSGKLVSVTTTSSTLIQSIPHLYKLAQYAVVIHVSLQPAASPDYSEITSIRQCGFVFLQSVTLQEVQDLAITAHALALKLGRGVIHFFDSSKIAEHKSITREDPALVKKLLSADSAQSRIVSNKHDPSLYAEDSGISTIVETGQSQAHQGHAKFDSHDTPASLTSPGDPSSASSRSDSHSDAQSVSTSPTSVDSTGTRGVSSEEIYKALVEIWAQLSMGTGRNYAPFGYHGPATAKAALFAFGADVSRLCTALNEAELSSPYSRCGLVTIRLYRPWMGTELSQMLPKSIEKVAVLEQMRRKTTRWGPVLLDVLTSLNTGLAPASTPAIVGYQLAQLNASTIPQALSGIFQNLLAANPIQNLEIGKPIDSSGVGAGHLSQQPQLENAYMRLLDQVFGQRLHVANSLGANNTGITAAISSTPEFGFGSLAARMERRNAFVHVVQEAAKSNNFVTDAPRQWLSRWALEADDAQRCEPLAQGAIDRLLVDGSALASKLLESKSLFSRESQWLIGSDAWAYDLANSGVHHVLASGRNVNMLIIDSQPYSERAAADSSRRKKDIGLYAMNFGNAYVASVAVYSSYTHVLEAMIEADRFNGPSVVLAYLPYNSEIESPIAVLQETKKAVDLGYWPLYRWTPAMDGNIEPSFQLDSERIKRELEEFLARENRLTQVTRREPFFAANLSGSYGAEVRKLQKRRAKDAYSKLLEGLYGAPMTILFASDNGNAENIAKRLANRGKARGLKSMVFAMDDYPIEDLSREENIVMITSTAGQGEFPQNGRAFWEAVKNSTDLDLATVNFAVFALGDSHYWPRKEDKIYYNKPGKDLHARLLSLSGRSLTECGLGDDQDPDSYQTGYTEWEPKLWHSLGVGNVEGLPEEPPPITNEDIKAESNYLRGTIGAGLQDQSTGAISASDQQLTKFHGTYQQDDRDLRDERKAQGLEPAYSFMIRCRLPGGVATPSQWLQMDEISTNLGNETIKLTTRQTFQFHGVVKGKLRPAMQAINKALMTTIAACGDVNRNVMCSSLPEQSAYHAEVHAISKKISDHLLPSTSAYHEIWLKDEDDKKVLVAGDAVVDYEPLYGPTYLPRKFKISIAIPPYNDTDVYAHDVGLIAIRGSDERLQGFNILAGGGMGVTHNNKKTYPRTGSMLGYCTADQAHIVCEKIMLVQKDYGDRQNRKHARLKYTMDDMGVDVFRGKVEEIWRQKFEIAKPFRFNSNIDTFGWQQDENGKHHFTMFIENGRVEDTVDFPMKTGLREVAKLHTGEFRLTGNQHLILSNVSPKALPQIKSMLAKYHLDNTNFSSLRLSSSACVAFPTCGLAMAESERYLPTLITKLEDTLESCGLRQNSIVMRMTGCPNGCARPWVAEIAFVGKAPLTYDMFLGGGYHGQRLNKLYRTNVKEEEILELMSGLLKRFANERTEGERFGDFVIRVGVIKETVEGKQFHEDTAEVEDED